MERLEARVSKSWAIRMAIAGIAFAGFGMASLYDGKVRYPEVNRDFKAYLAKYVGETPETLETRYTSDDNLRPFTGFCERWNHYWKSTRQGWLARRGWKDMDQSKLLVRERTPSGVPGDIILVDYIHSDWDLRTQFIMAAVCLPIGLGVLFRLIRALPRSISADDAVLHTLDGKDVPFSAITEIDKKKWDRKAIAIVHYEMGGEAGKALLDDWIYKGSAAILERIESVTNPPEEIEDLASAEDTDDEQTHADQEASS